MKELRFTGYSDDTFGWEPGGDDYDNCASGDHIVWRVAAGDDSLLVWGQYAPHDLGGGWLVGISPDDDGLGEGKPIRWPPPCSGQTWSA